MKILEGINYRQWQKRNTEKFNSFTKSQKKDARSQGYYNIGWDNVQKSWSIMSKLTQSVVSLFEHKLNKGEIVGAIDLSIIEADKAKQLARFALEELEQNQKKLDSLADKTLAKYPLL
ncbi:MAG: hypothetical protein AB4368_08890 [Xenococcaceae cyanobacterium]